MEFPKSVGRLPPLLIKPATLRSVSEYAFYHFKMDRPNSLKTYSKVT